MRRLQTPNSFNQTGQVVTVRSIIGGILGIVLSLGVAQFVSANSVDDQIAKRIQRVGSECVEGQDCASRMASTTVASADSGSGGGEATFKKTCSTCHQTGVAGAPKFGDFAEWAPRIKQGMDVLYTHAIHGKPPGMPARGMCFNCSDDDLKAAVNYMVDAAKANAK